MADTSTEDTSPSEPTEDLSAAKAEIEKGKSKSPRSSRMQFEWLRGLLRTMLQIILVALIGAAVGVTAYLLVPRGIQRVVEPVDKNTERIEAMEAELARMEGGQLDTAESQQQLLAEQQQRIDSVEDMFLQQDNVIDQQASDISELRDMLNGLEGQLGGQADALDDLESNLPGIDELAALNYNLLLMTGWQELTGARLHLAEGNIGQAGFDASNALETLRIAYEQSSDEQQSELDPIIDRLESVVDNLESDTLSATEDLEVVWSDLDRLIAGSLGQAPLDT